MLCVALVDMDIAYASSEEVDFGASWRTQGKGPWKVVWLEATGELVAFNESHENSIPGSAPPLEVQILDDVLRDGIAGLWRPPKGYADEVVIIGVEPDVLRLRGAVIGWEDHMPEENGLAWLAERVDELSSGHPD